MWKNKYYKYKYFGVVYKFSFSIWSTIEKVLDYFYSWMILEIKAGIKNILYIDMMIVVILFSKKLVILNALAIEWRKLKNS